MRKLLVLLVFVAIGCRQQTPDEILAEKNTIRHAKGLSIEKFDGYSVVTVRNPWPDAKENFSYILKKDGASVPDSLKHPVVNVPIKSIVVTSTTHIPSLEMLGVENTLIGFPKLDYISSDKVRTLVDAGKIRELGANENMNTESLIEMQPDVVIGYGIDNNNPTLENLKRSGLKVIVNGDWNEQSQLGKAEWIKLFGALYLLEAEAEKIFTQIETDYQTALAEAKKVTRRPTVLSGAMFNNRWMLPQGESWAALLIAHAGGNYLWSDTEGSASLALSYEDVLVRAADADFWISPGYFTSLEQMKQNNPHYAQFKSFQTGNVYSYSTTTGKSGGVLYYELGQNRPDLVLKDLIKILHPELLPGYEPFFFKKLK